MPYPAAVDAPLPLPHLLLDRAVPNGGRPMDEQQLFERLVRDCPDAVIYADADGLIRFWNAAATRIFGFAAEEALGQSLDLIIPERLRARHWAGYRKVMAGTPSRYGVGETLSVPATSKAGARLSIEFTVLPIRDRDGGMLGIAAFLRDATVRFEETRALRRELAALKAERPDERS